MHEGPPRVLVIDDDRAIRDVIATTLEVEGYEVALAANGRDGLREMERWRPDVIVLDLMMPEMDGQSFRAEQRARDGMASIPVIVLTATRDARAQAVLLGAAAWLAKPFDLDAVVDAVDLLAGRGR